MYSVLLLVLTAITVGLSVISWQSKYRSLGLMYFVRNLCVVSAVFNLADGMMLGHWSGYLVGALWVWSSLIWSGAIGLRLKAEREAKLNSFGG